MGRSHHRIIELDDDGCRRRLEAHRPRLGRVAFAEDGDPDWPVVLPVNYHYDGTAVYFRTFEGSKLFAALRRQRVAFEIDAIDGDWRLGWSVMVIGTLDVVRDPEIVDAVADTLESWATDETDSLVRLSIAQLSGREVIGPAAAQ